MKFTVEICLKSGNNGDKFGREAYEKVTDFRNKTNRLRFATFITCIGKEALEVHNGLRSQVKKRNPT